MARRTRTRAWPPVVGALALATAAAMAAGPVAGSGAASPKTVSVGHAPSVPTGARPATTPLPATVDVSVALRPADPDALQSFATAVSTPGSADYHQFLTPAEVQSRSGPSAATIAATRSWLSSTGLSVGATEGDGTVIPVSGSPSTVGDTFGTTLENYRLPSGRTAYANTVAPRLPADLAPDVAAVVGLDDLHPDTVDLATPPAAFTTRSPARPGTPPVARAAMAPPATRAATAGPAPCAAATGAAQALTSTVHTTTGPGATADQIAGAFGYTALYAQGDFGQGVTVGILMGGGDYRDSDLAYFEQCYGLHNPVNRVPVNGGATGVSSDGSIEVTMDVQTVASLAPDADVVVYEAPSLGPANTLDLYAAAVQADQAQVLTASFGGCEILDSDPYAEATLFQAMAAQGQSMFASAGDQGAQGCLATNAVLSPTLATLPIASDPASQPFVTSVGGVHITNLSTPATTVSVWNWGPFPEWRGNYVGGGGPSAVWAMPSWQVGVADSPYDGGTCGPTADTPCREVPTSPRATTPT